MHAPYRAHCDRLGTTPLSLRHTCQGTHMDSTEASLLVLDDEPNIRALLSASLRYAGFNVSSAASGAEAVAAVARQRSVLLLPVVMLPDMDGRAVVRRLRDEQ